MLGAANRMPVEGVTQGIRSGKRGSPLFSVMDRKGRISGDVAAWIAPV
jgi:hypothetical protein